MAAVRHLGFIGGISGPLTKSKSYLVVFVFVQKLVVIDAAVSIIGLYESFNILCVWFENAYSRPQNWSLGIFDHINGVQY